MADTEETTKAWQDFEAASRKVKQQTTMKSGGAGAENDYTTTYQNLVRLGEVTQLRGKYR